MSKTTKYYLKNTITGNIVFLPNYKHNHITSSLKMQLMRNGLNPSWYIIVTK